MKEETIKISKQEIIGHLRNKIGSLTLSKSKLTTDNERLKRILINKERYINKLKSENFIDSPPVQ